VVKEIIASGILPNGALQLICGSGRRFIGSRNSAGCNHFYRFCKHRVDAEINNPKILMRILLLIWKRIHDCIVLGMMYAGMPEWDIFIKEIRKEMTVKAGQKCHWGYQENFCSGK